MELLPTRDCEAGYGPGKARSKKKKKKKKKKSLSLEGVIAAQLAIESNLSLDIYVTQLSRMMVTFNDASW